MEMDRESAPQTHSLFILAQLPSAFPAHLAASINCFGPGAECLCPLAPGYPPSLLCINKSEARAWHMDFKGVQDHPGRRAVRKSKGALCTTEPQLHTALPGPRAATCSLEVLSHRTFCGNASVWWYLHVATDHRWPLGPSSVAEHD